MTDWPFEDSDDTCCMSVSQVLRDGQPILYVSRDEEDGMFQFLTGDPVSLEDAMLVSLGAVLRHDPSVRSVADLPPGAYATREHAAGSWQRSPAEPSA